MAITTPFFRANNSLTPTVQIRVADVNGVGKVDMNAIAGNPEQHLIVFSTQSDGGPTHVTLPYATAALRDTDFTAFSTQLSTSL